MSVRLNGEIYIAIGSFLDSDHCRYLRTFHPGWTGLTEFNASYKPIAPAYHAAPGTLDHWLTERYCLYAARKLSQVVYGETHHPQWRLQPAEVEVRANTMTQPIGLQLPDSKPISHFARYQQVVAWPIVPLPGITQAGKGERFAGL